MFDKLEEQYQETITLLLADYAAGTLDEPRTLLVDVWASLSKDASKMVCTMEAIGGVLLNDCEPAPMNNTSLETVLCQLSNVIPDRPIKQSYQNGYNFPAPLHCYIKEDMVWKSEAKGVDVCTLDITHGNAQTRIMKMTPNASIPSHVHEGIEMNIILEGGLGESGNYYDIGDLIIFNAKYQHAPIADKQKGCTCLSIICCDE